MFKCPRCNAEITKTIAEIEEEARKKEEEDVAESPLDEATSS